MSDSLVFGEPEVLIGLGIALALGMILQSLYTRRLGRLSLWIKRDLWPTVVSDQEHSGTRSKLRWVTLALALAVVALSKPRFGIEANPQAAKSLDIAIVLDLSNSMNAEDVVPSRLRVAKRAIGALLGALPSDRFALIGFAGKPNLLSPLTTDLDYVAEVLESADPSDLRPQGSDLGAALIAARDVHAGASEHPQGRVVVLFSDGEDHEGTFKEAAAKLKASAAVAAVVAVGSERGAPVPARDGSGRLGGYLKDAKGETVVSRVATPTLKGIAERAGAEMFDLSEGDKAIDALIAYLRRAERGELSQSTQPIYRERYQWPLFLALLVLLWETWGVASVRRVRGHVALVALGLGAASLAFCGHAQAVERAGSLGGYRHNQEGLERLKNRDPMAAAEAFAEARRQDPSSAVLDFNEGSARLGAGDAEGALQASEEAQAKALAQKNEELYASSAFNRGVALDKLERREDAARAYLDGLRRALESGQTDLAEQLRKKLEQSASQNNEKKKPDDQQDKGEQDQKQPQDQRQQSEQKRFRSDSLTREDAERIMKELAARERGLKEKLGKPKGTRQDALEKNW